MKIDCEWVQDVISLYRDGVLRENSRRQVEEHLESCAGCRAYYAAYDAGEPLPPESEGAPAIRIAGKLRSYRVFQIVLFVLSVLLSFVIWLPWFGEPGLTEIRGTILAERPVVLIGAALFLFAVWYPFRRVGRRAAYGYTGLGLLLASEWVEFFLVPAESLTGIQIGLFSIDLPNWAGISLADLPAIFRDSVAEARPGFYFGVLAVLALAAAFAFFLRRIR